MGSPLSGGAKETDPFQPDPIQQPRKGVSKWIKIGIPVAVIVIVAAVLGGVLGSRAAQRNRDESANPRQGNTEGGGTGGGKGANGELFKFATATNSEFMVPLYPSTVSYLWRYL